MFASPTRRDESRAARQAAIIAIARRNFLDHGYAATSMSTIAGKLGGSKGTLWAYFPSKEALFAAVLDDVTEAFRAQLYDALRPGRDCRTTLLDFARRFSEKLLSPDAVSLYRLVIGEGGRFPEIGRLFDDRGPAQVKARLATYLEREMAAGHFRRADPFRAAQHLIQLIQIRHNTQLWGSAGPLPAEERERDAQDAVDLFHRAYAPD
ncbi:TetR/AcrR family transcriptional regulator [Sphingomonas sp. CFBP 13720]|uniref:TetR/AcrR family transcriptional regulator n=1 Tax=Sphingomonas sp. CFBP 13720 TaxID=2775302 RepID=UPI00177E40B6|nr:TetR/AcrR family transcriptional regulator [Sphingomonas sp. CFBP 13720]MBD8678577.1 TetR/AcrR family transcriptional regulator [Sphingomonas sp. CFBP 13720]